MNAPVIASFNSTTVRSNITPWLSVMRAYFAVASRLMPQVARRQAERFFTAPPPFAGRTEHPVAARRETVTSDNHTIAVWQAGPVSAPAVLLVHGWGGRGTQMGRFVAPLLAEGYRVVWFDQPGHGESGDRLVGLPDFASAVQALSATHGPFEAAIGHSLGAASLMLALRRGLRIGRVVFVSSPASMQEHAHKFARLLGIPPSIREAMRERLERRYGVPFDEIDRIDALARLHVPALFVHDHADREVPFEHALRLSSHMTGAKLIKTYGLGHYRLLREPAVIRSIVDFVRGDVEALPAELPVLPRPAPIY